MRALLTLSLGLFLGCASTPETKTPPKSSCGSYTTGPATCTWAPAWVEPSTDSQEGQCPSEQVLGCCSYDNATGEIDKVTCSYAEDLPPGESAGPSKSEAEKECKAAKGTWGFVFPKCN